MQAGIINGARQSFSPGFDDAQASGQVPPQDNDSASLATLNAGLATQKNAAVLAAVQRLKMDGQAGPGSVDAETAADNAAASVPPVNLQALHDATSDAGSPLAAQQPLSGVPPVAAPASVTQAATDPAAGSKDPSSADPASQTLSGQASDNPDAYNGSGTEPNVEGAVNQQPGSNVKTLHPINNIPDKTILDGRADPVNYATATIDRDNKVINIAVKVNYEKTFILNPTASRVSDEEYQRLVGLANAGMEKYWSRSVELDGQQYQVHVTAVNDKDGMPITVAHPGWSIFGDNISSRSYNAWPIHEGTIYYTHEQDRNDDADFARTAAHEIGHGFLTNAFGIGWSWGHEGTSSMLGGMHSDVDPYPASGEIGLMPYYGGIPPWDYYNRSVASENDVKTLLYIAGRRN